MLKALKLHQLRSEKESSILYGRNKIGSIRLVSSHFNQHQGQSVVNERWVWTITQRSGFPFQAATGEASSRDEAWQAAFAEASQHVDA
jgi:transposase